jgi:thiamine biosynthesis lipoprotein
MLLEAGGDIVASGLGPIEGRWSVGIEDPALRGQLIATVTLGQGAIATSSIAVRQWGSSGRQVHHLIDPAGRAPADSNLLAVTVAWHDPAWAEIWSKALFIAGRTLIGPESRSRDLAVWWVESDGSIHMTPAARQLTTWVRDEVFAA